MFPSPYTDHQVCLQLSAYPCLASRKTGRDTRSAHPVFLPWRNAEDLGTRLRLVWSRLAEAWTFSMKTPSFPAVTDSSRSL